MNKSVIITDKEVEGLEGRWGPFMHLRMKFLTEHALNFEEDEFMDQTKFKFWRSEDNTAYKVDYVGPEKP